MKYFLLLLPIILVGCLTTPDFDTGEGCWRYGVAEIDNSGALADLNNVPDVLLGADDLLVACNIETEPVGWSNRNLPIMGCFIDDTIYRYKFSGDVTYNHEACHVVLGEKHNACNGKGYGFTGDDATTCAEL